jgi:hypothetical protein
MEVIDPCNALLTNIELSSLLLRMREGPSSNSPNLNTLVVELRQYLDKVGLPPSLRVPDAIIPPDANKDLEKFLKEQHQQEQKKVIAHAHSKLNDLAHLLVQEAPLNAPQLLALLNELPSRQDLVCLLLEPASGNDHLSPKDITEEQINNIVVLVDYLLHHQQ